MWLSHNTVAYRKKQMKNSLHVQTGHCSGPLNPGVTAGKYFPVCRGIISAAC